MSTGVSAVRLRNQSLRSFSVPGMTCSFTPRDRKHFASPSVTDNRPPGPDQNPTCKSPPLNTVAARSRCTYRRTNAVLPTPGNPPNTPIRAPEPPEDHRLPSHSTSVSRSTNNPICGSISCGTTIPEPLGEALSNDLISPHFTSTLLNHNATRLEFTDTTATRHDTDPTALPNRESTAPSPRR